MTIKMYSKNVFKAGYWKHTAKWQRLFAVFEQEIQDFSDFDYKHDQKWSEPHRKCIKSIDQWKILYNIIILILL